MHPAGQEAAKLRYVGGRIKPRYELREFPTDTTFTIYDTESRRIVAVHGDRKIAHQEALRTLTRGFKVPRTHR